MRSVARTILALAVAACGSAGEETRAQDAAAPAGTAAQRSPTPDPTPGVVRSEVVARGLEHPWALAILPDGRFLVTERPGRMRIVSADGSLSAPLTGVPEVAAVGQGGLLDVTLHPDFAENRLVYFSFSEPGTGGTASTAVGRGRLGERGLESVEIIYRQQPKVQSRGHYGSRIVFDRDGHLFITQGDRMNQRPLVQDLSTGIGKIMRIAEDGSVPDDNPFVTRDGALPEIWSYGHRNVQAAALHPETGQLWTVEHGARGGDELNHPEAGKNYGWPVITYGVDYSGERIGEGAARAGMEQPVYYWDPVIAPSGMVWYTGDAFPGWRGSVLIGSMSPGALVRLVLDNGRVTREERYLADLDVRFRDVQQGSDGLIYVVTDEDDGQLLRLRPAGGG
ncbi:MAG: PQQ-dependent sugar dehydrogenase [Gemmatimonadota bacterium]|nr:PQQ-dependent sugar dehydrogenase [Gemmatimonadota bacterium]